MSTERVALFVEEIALDKIQGRISDPTSLFAMDPEDNRLRHMLSKSPEEALFLVTALANVVTTRNFVRDLPQRKDSGGLLSVSDNSPYSLEERVAMVVTFLILDVAYLDGDSRDKLSKPAREILGLMCEIHPPLVSFILSFVERHFKDMGSMAEYLFRELPLAQWRMTRSDFNTLTRLLETPPLNSTESHFARSLFSSIPWSKGTPQYLLTISNLYVDLSINIYDIQPQ